MDIVLIADTHFSHESLTEDGFRPKGFSEKILKNLKRMVTPETTLIHLGDVSFDKDDYWHKEITMLPWERKYLIIGNHDKRSYSWYIDRGWDFVGQEIGLHAFGKKILLSHMPRPIGDYDANVHGHFHQFTMEKIKEVEPELFALIDDKHYLISLEKLNYEPIKLKRVIELFDKNGSVA